jgi:hypothetical protein
VVEPAFVSQSLRAGSKARKLTVCVILEFGYVCVLLDNACVVHHSQNQP